MALILCLGIAPFPGIAHMAASPEPSVVIKDAKLDQALRDILQKTGDSPLTMAELQSLTSLDLANRGIRDLNGLEHAVNLAELNLSDNEISDLSPLRPLEALRELYVARNRLASLEGLSGLKELNHLEAPENEIDSLAVVGSLPKLQALDVSYNKIASLDAISSATNLTSLKINGNRIKRLEPVAGLAKLASLSVGYNEIADLSPLRSVHTLQALSIDGNRVSDLGPLRDLTGMRSLIAGNNRIEDLSPLRKLNELYMLWLDRNRIYDLAPLQGLTKLKDLNLSNNRVWNLEPIQHIQFDLSYDTGAIRYGLAVTDNYLDTRAGTKTKALIDKLNADVLPATQKLAQRLVIGSGTAYVGDKSYALQTAPFMQSGRTYMPIRFVSEKLGATVSWNAAKKQVTIAKGGKKIQWTAGEKKAIVNGQAVAYDVPMLIKNGSTVMPIRFISEQLQSSVEYVPAQKMALIFDEA